MPPPSATAPGSALILTGRIADLVRDCRSVVALTGGRDGRWHRQKPREKSGRRASPPARVAVCALGGRPRSPVKTRPSLAKISPRRLLRQRCPIAQAEWSSQPATFAFGGPRSDVNQQPFVSTSSSGVTTQCGVSNHGWCVGIWNTFGGYGAIPNPKPLRQDCMGRLQRRVPGAAPQCAACPCIRPRVGPKPVVLLILLLLLILFIIIIFLLMLMELPDLRFGTSASRIGLRER
jgi:hypothetical protein